MTASRQRRMPLSQAKAHAATGQHFIAIRGPHKGRFASLEGVSVRDETFNAEWDRLYDMGGTDATRTLKSSSLKPDCARVCYQDDIVRLWSSRDANDDSKGWAYCGRFAHTAKATNLDTFLRCFRPIEWTLVKGAIAIITLTAGSEFNHTATRRVRVALQDAALSEAIQEERYQVRQDARRAEAAA